MGDELENPGVIGQEGPAGKSAKAIKKNEHVLAPILATIGASKLRDLTAGDVHQALTVMAQRHLSAAVAMGHDARLPRPVSRDRQPH